MPRYQTAIQRMIQTLPSSAFASIWSVMLNHPEDGHLQSSHMPQASAQTTHQPIHTEATIADESKNQTP